MGGPASSAARLYLTAVTTAGDAIKSEDDAAAAAVAVSKAAAVNVDTGDGADEAAAEAAAGRLPPPLLFWVPSSIWIRLVRIWSW